MALLFSCNQQKLVKAWQSSSIRWYTSAKEPLVVGNSGLLQLRYCWVYCGMHDLRNVIQTRSKVGQTQKTHSISSENARWTYAKATLIHLQACRNRQLYRNVVHRLLQTRSCTFKSPCRVLFDGLNSLQSFRNPYKWTSSAATRGLQS